MKRSMIAAAALLVSSSAFAITPFSLPWKNHDPRDGSEYKTAEHPDGVFVLEFFANFCPACNENAANVNDLADQYKDEPRVQVIDMTLDTSEREIQAWISNHAPNHPVVQDVNRQVWRQINSQYIPTTVVMDCKGNVVFQQSDLWDATEAQAIRSKVDELLKQGCN